MEASAEVLEGVRKREYVLEVRVLFPKNGAEAEPEEEEEDDEVLDKVYDRVLLCLPPLYPLEPSHPSQARFYRGFLCV